MPDEDAPYTLWLREHGLDLLHLFLLLLIFVGVTIAAVRRGDAEASATKERAAIRASNAKEHGELRSAVTRVQDQRVVLLGRVEGVDKRIDALDKRLDRMEVKVDRLTDAVHLVAVSMARIEMKLGTQPRAAAQ